MRTDPPNKAAKSNHRIQLILIGFTLLTSCSGFNIGVGGGSSAPNDARPTGTILHQNQINGMNGQTASGNALMYAGTGIGNYTLRLEGVTLPSESGMTIKVYANIQGLVSTLTLRASSGSQNYSMTGLSPNLTFSGVYIYSTVRGMDYASAIFN